MTGTVINPRYSLENLIHGATELVAGLGSNRFWLRLAAFFLKLVEHHGCVAFCYESNSEPVLVFGNLKTTVSRDGFGEYRKNTYLLDPFFQAFRNRMPNGVYRLRDISADRFFQSEFYKSYYCRTGLTDEIGIFTWTAEKRLIVISLARQNIHGSFSKGEIGQLVAIEPLLSALIKHHIKLADRPSTEPRTAIRTKREIPADRQPRKIHFDGPNSLTTREYEIAELILKGHSSLSISLVLSISTDTVKAHRRHIYRKLSVGSQAELFALAVKS